VSAINSQYKSIIEKIRRYASKKGHFIVFDGDYDSKVVSPKSPTHFDKKTNTFTVSVYGLTGKTKAAFLALIRELHESGHLLFKKNKTEEVFNYAEYSKNNKADRDILNYYKDVIPNEDLQALEVSMYMRAKAKKGKNIFGDKNDVRNAFGDIGVYISNLCSLDYFEGEIMQMHKNQPKKEFDKYYDKAITKKARAMFVYTGMTEKQLNTDIYNMVAKLRTYHLNRFTIHAKGGNNVSAIKSFYNKRNPKEDGFIMEENVKDTSAEKISYDVKLYEEE
jgi:hypothetical protein